MKYQHAMPFGARLTPEGAAFALWAPSASRVELVWRPAARGHAAEAPVAMQPGPQGEGWWQAELAGARAGDRYSYRVRTEAQAEPVEVPDPASRFNPEDTHGPSELQDPEAFDWEDDGAGDPWPGRPWHEAVAYELHIGTFTPEGTYVAAEARLPYLLELGVTAVELLPLAEFSGARGWGYDGVLPFAPESSYGTPAELKRFIQAAHRLGLMVMLDVVYNHFGPDGNYLPLYAQPFFTDKHRTPWGEAIGFDGERSKVVRDFYVHNALYWLNELRFDGLRFDAVHAIADDSSTHFLTELSARIREAIEPGRHVHLVLENDDNGARWLGGATRTAVGAAASFDAQWNDDFHHAAHVALTGESGGYYADYAAQPVALLARCFGEGFAYQGEPSPHREGAARGEPSAHLLPLAFMNFLQNHDQVGNRPYGERLCALAPRPALEALTRAWLLAPPPPMLFMGDEFAAATPFLFFCDFQGELRKAVTEGRLREMAALIGVNSAADAERPIPDPNDEATFLASKLDWASLDAEPHATTLTMYRELLALRARTIVPLLPRLTPGASRFMVLGDRGLQVSWLLNDGAALVIQLNLGDTPLTCPVLDGEHIHSAGDIGSGLLGPAAMLCVLVQGAPNEAVAANDEEEVGVTVGAA